MKAFSFHRLLPYFQRSPAELSTRDELRVSDISEVAFPALPVRVIVMHTYILVAEKDRLSWPMATTINYLDLEKKTGRAIKEQNQNPVNFNSKFSLSHIYMFMFK